jgi:hypothetical protein
MYVGLGPFVGRRRPNSTRTLFFYKKGKKKVMPNIDPWSACQSLIGRTPCHCDSSDNDWSTYRHKKTISGHGDAL